MQHIKLGFTVLICMMLGGCFSPVSLPQQNLYTLNPAVKIMASKQHSSKTLLVMSTQASDELSTQKMAYVNKPYQLAYFAKNSWIAEPADQLSALITSTLQQTHYFKAVVTTPFVGVTDLKLNTYLYTLQQNFLFNPSREQFKLSAQLVNAATGKLIAEKTFQYAIPAGSNNPYGGVVAANRAIQQMLQGLVSFVITRG